MSDNHVLLSPEGDARRSAILEATLQAAGAKRRYRRVARVGLSTLTLFAASLAVYAMSDGPKKSSQRTVASSAPSVATPIKTIVAPDEGPLVTLIPSAEPRGVRFIATDTDAMLSRYVAAPPDVSIVRVIDDAQLLAALNRSGRQVGLAYIGDKAILIP